MSAPSGLRARVVATIGPLAIDVELDTSPGTLALVGPNGAGKTSLLTVVLGLRRLERGRIAIGERVLADPAAGIDLAVEHRRIGYVPQDYGLFPHLTVRRHLEFALGSAPAPPDRAERAHRVDAALNDLGLRHLADRRPRALSGGEKQRLALARALIVEPHALLLDEPLAALDVHARAEVREFLASYLAPLSLPTIVVTHDVADALILGHRIAVMESGSITQTGTHAELFAGPASRFVEEWLAAARPH